MKAVMLSVRPKWCELIANGKKTVEVRKSRTKLETPFKCYIYCTKEKIPGEILLTKDGAVEGRNRGFRDNGDKPLAGKVIGEFICDSIRCFDVPYPAFQDKLDKSIIADSCCTYYMLHRYAYHDALYGWHISDLKIYDDPIDLCFFNRTYTDTESMIYTLPMQRPPQSWGYVQRGVLHEML